MSSLWFTEEMKGYVAFGEADYAEGFRKGKEAGNFFMFHLTIEVDDVDVFVADARHRADVRGWVRCDALGGKLAVEGGLFNLFVDTDVVGRTNMLYRLYFTDPSGRRLTMTGFKVVEDHPGLDVWPDTSTLYVRLLSGHVDEAEEGGADLVAAGRIHIYLLDFARQLTTFRVKAPTTGERARALHAFGKVFAGKLWDTYAPLAHPGRQDLRYETTIDARPEEVWDTLVDTGSWPEWNPTFLRANGPLAVGTDVKMRVQLGSFNLPMRQRILEVDRPRTLRWKTRQAPGLFEVDRTFEFEALAGDRTHFVQYEIGATALARSAIPFLRKPIEAGYVNLAAALAARVADGAPPGEPT